MRFSTPIHQSVKGTEDVLSTGPRRPRAGPQSTMRSLTLAGPANHGAAGLRQPNTTLSCFDRSNPPRGQPQSSCARLADHASSSSSSGTGIPGGSERAIEAQGEEPHLEAV